MSIESEDSDERKRKVQHTGTGGQVKLCSPARWKAVGGTTSYGYGARDAGWFVKFHGKRQARRKPRSVLVISPRGA